MDAEIYFDTPIKDFIINYEYENVTHIDVFISTNDGEWTIFEYNSPATGIFTATLSEVLYSIGDIISFKIVNHNNSDVFDVASTVIIAEYDTMTFTARSEGDQTINLSTLMLSENSVIHWGDDSSDTLLANFNYSNLSHTYAESGLFTVTIEKSNKIRRFVWWHGNKFSGINTEHLQRANLIEFSINSPQPDSPNIIKSEHMINWTDCTHWSLNSIQYEGTYEIKSEHMTNWNIINWYLTSMPAGTYEIKTEHMTTWSGNQWHLFFMPAGTYEIKTEHMTTWDGLYWTLGSMPAGTYEIKSEHMTTWYAWGWRLSFMPAGTYEIKTEHMTTWTISNIWELNNIVLTSSSDINSFHMRDFLPTGTGLYLHDITGGSFNIDTMHFDNYNNLLSFSLYNLPNGTYNIHDNLAQNWTIIRDIRLNNLIDSGTGLNILSNESEIIKIIDSIYTNRNIYVPMFKPTLRLNEGTNATLTDNATKLKVDHLRAGDDGSGIPFQPWDVYVKGH